jgi:CheY-like chemotaxis protein
MGPGGRPSRPGLWRAGRRLLERYGFEVLEARDGADALRRFAERQGHVHLVITDLAMPAVGGAALVRELRTSHPDLPVLLVSGDRDQGAETEQFGDPTLFLEKPFLADELLDAVRQLLDEADGSQRAPSNLP